MTNYQRCFRMRRFFLYRKIMPAPYGSIQAMKVLEDIKTIGSIFILQRMDYVIIQIPFSSIQRMAVYSLVVTRE